MLGPTYGGGHEVTSQWLISQHMNLEVYQTKSWATPCGSDGRIFAESAQVLLPS